MPYTNDQLAAIKARDRNILVAAAAGSGKTRVLVERIIRQLTAGELDVDELLVVTFTNAAAAEMRDLLRPARYSMSGAGTTNSRHVSTTTILRLKKLLKTAPQPH